MLKSLEFLILFLEVGNHLFQNKAGFIYNPLQMVLPYLDLGFTSLRLRKVMQSCWR
jgi:hypothetical protein